jgi:hypothetical protein
MAAQSLESHCPRRVVPPPKRSPSGELTPGAIEILNRIIPGTDDLNSPFESLQTIRKSTDDQIVVEGPPIAVGPEELKRFGEKAHRGSRSAKRPRSET